MVASLSGTFKEAGFGGPKVAETSLKMDFTGAATYTYAFGKGLIPDSPTVTSSFDPSAPSM